MGFVVILFCNKLKVLSLAKPSNAGSNPASGSERENGKIAISKLRETMWVVPLGQALAFNQKTPGQDESVKTLMLVGE